MVVLCLAGKPNHDVGGELRQRLHLAERARDAQILRAPVAAMHRT